MKKLITSIVAIAIGLAANAASYAWKAQSGYIWDGEATPSKVTSGTAYLMFVDVMSQTDLVSAFKMDSANAATQVAKKALDDASVAENARIALTDTFDASYTSDQKAYFVIFKGDKMYVSIEADAAYAAMGDSTISFGSVTASSKTTLDASKGYTTAGWYEASTSPVPEPTSGLLMLLGFCGLALRRRRA